MTPKDRELIIAQLVWITGWHVEAYEKMNDDDLQKEWERRNE